MVNESKVMTDDNSATTNDLCYDLDSRQNETKFKYSGPKYDWSSSTQGVILGSYFYGYTVTQMLGSYADRFGAKWMTCLGIMLPALFNALIPVLSQWHYGLVVFMRVLIGAFHGVVYASVFSLMAKWFPQTEKNLAVSGTLFFGNFGGVITMPIVGYLCKADFLDGWPASYYLTSIIHIIWFVLWYFFVHNSPSDDPNISVQELDYITENNPQSHNHNKLIIPWKSIFLSRPVWASIMTRMCGSFGYYLLCTKMPTYLDTVFGMSIQSNSWFNSMMYGMLCIFNITAGPFSDWVRSKQWISQTRNRKNFHTFALITPAICLILIPVVKCNNNAAIALMLIGMAAYGFITGGEYGVVPEYAPNMAGTVFGVTNTLASSTGFVGPLIVGVLLDNGGGNGIRHQWDIVWYLSGAIFAFGALSFELGGTAEPQSWSLIANSDNRKSIEHDDISIISKIQSYNKLMSFRIKTTQVINTNKPLVPCRLQIGILGCLGCTLLYILRSNLSVAIIAMVEETTSVSEDRHKSQDLCYNVDTYNTSTGHDSKGIYQWNDSVQGIILGSYFYGYTATQLFGSYADRFGAKWMAGLGIFAPAVCNALIPVLANIHYGLLVCMRVLIGAFHGVVYSSMFSLFAKWFPTTEKNFAIMGTTFAGNIGGVLTMPMAGYLIKTDFLRGWPSVFYMTSLVHVIWFIIWCILVTNSPDENSRITDSELKYIVANNPSSRSARNMTIPWRSILASKVVWASIIVKSTGSFGYYLLCTKMPQYLDSIFGMAIHTNSWFNALMYVVLCTTLLAGSPLSSWIQTKGWFSQTRNRKNFQSLAMFGCALCLILVPIVECDSSAVIALLLLAMFVYGFITGGEYGVIVEYAPDFSGTVFGVANTLASATGFVGPMIVGLLLDHREATGARHQWNTIWYLSAGICLFGGLFYELFGTAEPQEWAVVNNREDRYRSPKKISIVSQHLFCE
ncbi:uncharacterized protein LOC128958258 [Oppia nitens]|uniref:uncharacterized protein LOC128958258 n=1 Tax=Oppia nitens TaxID=1686743 RepID=UPI0023DC6E73|nr:uncharacterized protein LOC128958258 [Oppia nitens]